MEQTDVAFYFPWPQRSNIQQQERQERVQEATSAFSVSERPVEIGYMKGYSVYSNASRTSTAGNAFQIFSFWHEPPHKKNVSIAACN